MVRNIACLLAWIFILPVSIKAQLSDEQVDHLNHYVAYINESSHTLKEIRRTLETFNLHLNHAYGKEVKGSYAQSFEVESLIENQRYFVDHLCTRLPGAETPIANLKLIHATIRAKKGLLPEVLNDSLQPKLEALHQNVLHLLKITDKLASHTSGKAYLQEAHFQSSYELLIQFKGAYEGYFLQKTQLHKQLRMAYQAYPVELQELINAYDLNREILHAIRKDDSVGVERLLPLYVRQIEKIRNMDKDFLQNEEKYSYHDAETFSFLNKHMGRIEKLANQYLRYERPTLEPIVADILPYPAYGNDCYYYNEILGKHNEHYVGYTFFLNRSLIHPQKNMLNFPEEPYWYEVAIPINHPLIKSQQTYLKPNPTKAVAANTPMAGSPASNLIFLLDISGSMQRYNKMPLLKTAFVNLLSYMRPEDQVGIVTYSGQAKVELSPTSATQRGKIIQTIEALSGSGKTNAAKGLKLAYQQAEGHLIPNGTNRIILATDGDLEKAYGMKKMIEAYVDKGISLTIFYFPTIGDHPSLKLRLAHFTRTTAGNFRKVHKGNIDQILLEEAKGLLVPETK